MITPAYAPTATERVLPRLALDFTTGVLDSRVTVTRALNTATRVNSSGYIEGVNADLPRFDYDPATLAPKGLLIEESRANLLTYSNDMSNPTWNRSNITRTVSGVNSPDGTANANSLAATANGTAIFNTSAYAITGTAATFSVYVRQGTGATTSNYYGMRNQTTATTLVLGRLNFSTGVWTYINGSTGVTVRNAGNGWWRLEIAVTSGITSGNSVFAYVGYAGQAVTAGEYSDAFGAQLEAGSFATSYIPTTTTSLTRNADVVTMTGTNFSSWYNATEGAIFCQIYRSDASGGSRGAWSIRGASGNDSMDFRPYASQITAQVGGIPQVDIYPGGGSANAVVKNCFGYKLDSFAASTNAGNPATDTSGTVPTVTQLIIGALSGATGQVLCGHVQKISYWPIRLTNAEIRAFSK